MYLAIVKKRKEKPKLNGLSVILHTVIKSVNKTCLFVCLLVDCLREWREVRAKYTSALESMACLPDKNLLER